MAQGLVPVGVRRYHVTWKGLSLQWVVRLYLSVRVRNVR
jgi:hypothetical protein